MARNNNKRRSKSSDAEVDVAPAVDEQSAPLPSETRMWLEEAWTGWLGPLMGVAVLGAIAAAYKYGYLGDNLLGPLLILTVGAVAVGWPLIALLSRSRNVMKGPSIAVALLGLFGATYPALRIAMPGPVLGLASLNKTTTTAHVTTPSVPLVAVVSGELQPGGEGEASYSIDIANGDAHETIDGVFKRQTVSRRTGRKGGTSTAVMEQTEQLHRLLRVAGGAVVLTTEAVSDKLQNGLTIELHAAPLSPYICWGAAGFALLVAFFLDGKQSQRGKRGQRSYLTLGIAVALAFGVRMVLDSSPHTSVGPAIGSLLFGFAVGGLPGWALTSIARSMFGRPPTVER